LAIVFIHLGVPVKPMLAKPTKGIQIVLKRFENISFTCEYKYDGFRGQIHYRNNNNNPIVEIFSRNLENMTQSYPDITEFVLDAVSSSDLQDFILDSEIVAFDKTHVFLIQTLMF
jgi:DNA ligase 1